ncbi:sporulation specific transcriptional regulator GerR [Bacillus carboniphilus]|uniref:Sporulation specific transcriptional regulator GerR n=1 Tax=Bacillus carboniphilus TaxID=86663 RepID=A0ABN0WIG1_9BACI
MTSTRQDAWTKDEDVLLSEVVLRHIREGSTQLQAFEEVGKKLSRTPAACGFRWNSLVRKQYKSGIELAKKQRKERKKQRQANGRQYTEHASSSTSQEGTVPNLIRSIIHSLEDIERQWTEHEKNLELEEKVSKLQHEVEGVKKERDHWLTEYKTLLGVMEKARKLVYLEEEVGKKKAKSGK